jgi:1-acyl-sn-glycerol-3-phosphate acyltransferase
MIPANPSRLAQLWFDNWCRRNLRKHFYRVHVYLDSTDQWSRFDPHRPRVYAANHCSFWDGIVLNHLLRTFRRAQPLYCMIDVEQVREHPFMSRVGGFSIDRNSPRDAMESVRYATALLQETSHPSAIVVFPQGRIEPNDTRPIRVEAAVTRLVEQNPASEIVPIALRYDFWTEQRAEALVHVGRAISASELTTTGQQSFARGAEFRRNIASVVSQRIAHGLDCLREQSRAFRPADRIVLMGRESISKWKRRFTLGGE